MNEKYCCEDWPVQIELVNGPIVLQAARSGFRNQFQGKQFVFCPWCGKKRPTQANPDMLAYERWANEHCSILKQFNPDVIPVMCSAWKAALEYARKDNK